MSFTWPVFVDRCLGGRRMKPVLVDAGWSVSLHDERFTQDAPDTEWLPVIASEGLVILTRDKLVRRRPDERLAIVESKARVVFVSFQGNMHSYVGALLAAEKRLQRLFDEHAAPVAIRLRRDGSADVWPFDDAA